MQGGRLTLAGLTVKPHAALLISLAYWDGCAVAPPHAPSGPEPGVGQMIPREPLEAKTPRKGLVMPRGPPGARKVVHGAGRSGGQRGVDVRSLNAARVVAGRAAAARLQRGRERDAVGGRVRQQEQAHHARPQRRQAHDRACRGLSGIDGRACQLCQCCGPGYAGRCRSSRAPAEHSLDKLFVPGLPSKAQGRAVKQDRPDLVCAALAEARRSGPGARAAARSERTTLAQTLESAQAGAPQCVASGRRASSSARSSCAVSAWRAHYPSPNPRTCSGARAVVRGQRPARVKQRTQQLRRDARLQALVRAAEAGARGRHERARAPPQRPVVGARRAGAQAARDQARQRGRHQLVQVRLQAQVAIGQQRARGLRAASR
jgi:hypothetical protein